MEYAKNKAALFNEDNYALWSRRMQVHLLAQGYEVWEIVKQGYQATKDEQGKKNIIKDAKERDIIITGLNQSIYVKVLGYKIVKEVWEKLQNIHARESKVKEENSETICQ